ncbi:metal dependent phosphohydrolase [Desulfarculus baarsii DSM 2075]|uniref:Metal dependent phosphohydrolase n=1 Tax=Desulfarculus baarsii (strain ATCC 33931 / DSM 2075 / LMG 7858 / VKM B-1802 / 2st14) TaxID=644282 RepID=E1QE36_DESB2|nr:HD domain-containing phosphohydrolase [Desulfarculus baarsii]ADK83822.1 metal dependent phosphohydrolase [Desulfarculus baarsii DSM 2075]
MPAEPAHDQAEIQRVRRPQVWCYRGIPIYRRDARGDLVLFKDRGRTLAEMGFDERTLPGELYVLRRDKLSAIAEVQAGLNGRMLAAAAVGDHQRVKLILTQIVEETFADPRAGNLEALGQTVKGLVEVYAGTGAALQRMALMTSKDYSTAVHSVNVAALVMGFCLFQKRPQAEVINLGLAALLHDLGKLFIDGGVLTAQRRLTSDEFAQIKAHPTRGLEALAGGDFPAEVALAVAQHHEKIDGSGYPLGLTYFSEAGQLVGLVDCYEALTSDERVYRPPMTPLDTLKLLKGDMAAGKFDRALFEQFAYSLV